MMRIATDRPDKLPVASYGNWQPATENWQLHRQDTRSRLALVSWTGWMGSNSGPGGVIRVVCPKRPARRACRAEARSAKGLPRRSAEREGLAAPKRGARRRAG